MKRSIKTLFFLFFFVSFFSALPLHPQPQEASFRRYTADDGLESSHITSLLQDYRGFLWVGTGNGLYRFDGYRFEAFKRDPADPASISDNSVNALYEDRFHKLWIGTTNGLNAFDPHTEKFAYYRNTQKGADSTGRNFIASLSGDEHGTLWVGTHGDGVYQFNQATQKFSRVELNLPNPLIPGWLEISAILWDPTAPNKIWLGTFKQGLLKLDPASGNFLQYTHDPSDPQSLGSNNIISLHRDRRGTIWVGTHQGGLARVRDDHLTAVQFLKLDREYFKTVGSISEDQEGVLWFGTSGAGLIAYDPETGRFKIFKSDPAHPRTLSDDWIMTQYLDRAGNLWIGTRSGLNKLQIPQKKITHIKKIPADPQSLLDNNVNAIYEDRQRRLWVGTAGGLSVFDAQSKLIANYKNDPKDTASLSLNFVQVVGADSYGNIWVGTFGGGLNLLRLRPGQILSGAEGFTRFRQIPADTTSLTQNFVSTIYEDGAGNLWIGTLGGLNKLDRRRNCFIRYKSSSKNPRALNHNGITGMLEDRESRLWIGTYGGGLNRLDRATDKFTHYTSDRANPNSLSDNIVYCLFEDANGLLWIGTNGGLNRFNPESGQFTHYLEKDGLPNNAALGILSDTDGNLWISTNNGLCKFDDRLPAGQKFVNFDARKDGLQANEFNQSAFHQNRNGELFFGGPNGFNRFYPQDLKPKSAAPNLVITALSKFNKPVALDTAITEAAEIKLSYNDSFFSLDFAALDFTLPEKNEYAYKLEGFNNDWLYCANQHTATFTNLNPGSYVFKVKGANSDGVWNEAGAALRIVITPLFWQTWWFRLAAGGGILFLAYMFFRLRLAKAVAVERLRVRIASDLHDDIGATLTKISLHSDLIQDGACSPEVLASLRKIGVMSRELVMTMNDIVWSIDARNDTAGNLIDHMRDFADSVCSPRQIEVQFEESGIDPDKNLPADIRQNLYLIFKEAVHNAAKYAEASRLFIKLQNLNGAFKMRIADDGKGFAAPRQSGHGLRNMQMRAARLGAKLEVKMENGVTVLLEGKAI